MVPNSLSQACLMTSKTSRFSSKISQSWLIITQCNSPLSSREEQLKIRDQPLNTEFNRNCGMPKMMFFKHPFVELLKYLQICSVHHDDCAEEQVFNNVNYFSTYIFYIHQSKKHMKTSCFE